MQYSVVSIQLNSASEMAYIVSSGALNSTHSLTHSTQSRHMSYVSRKIHTKQRYCTIFTTFRCHCHSAI